MAVETNSVNTGASGGAGSFASMLRPTADVDAGVESHDVPDGTYDPGVVNDTDFAEEPAGDEDDRSTATDKIPDDESGTKTGEPGDDGEPAPEKLEELIRTIAEELDLDPEKNRDVLLKLAERDKRNLDSKRDEDQTADWLTPWEKEQAEKQTAGGEKPPAPAEGGEKPPAAGEGAPPPAPFKFGDIGDNWKNLVEGEEALAAAWDAGDSQKVTQIQDALHARRFMAQGLPVALAITERMIAQKLDAFQKQFKDVFDDSRQNRDERLDRNARDWAQNQLGKSGKTEIFTKLFALDGGKPVVYQGEEVDACPYNRLVTQHPELLKIKVEHKDPDTALRLTYLERYRMVGKLYERLQGEGKVSASEAKALLKAGSDSRKRDEQARTRQRLNAGSQPATTPKTGDDYNDRIVGLSGGGSVRKILGG